MQTRSNFHTPCFIGPIPTKYLCMLAYFDRLSIKPQINLKYKIFKMFKCFLVLDQVWSKKILGSD
jgi:hypothetical protein